jgi:DNA polymerase III delta prime subunit
MNTNIYFQFQYFLQQQKIPNILLYGANGSGKKTILLNFLHNLYRHDKPLIKEHVMYVNCAHGKGIKFVRDEVKQFAKSNIHSKNGNIFKSIILLNADTLTIDAQSALRRCIEVFAHTTRFFIVVESLQNILKPILSRFCQIHVPNVNMYQICVAENVSDSGIQSEISDKKLGCILKRHNANTVYQLVDELYDMAVSSNRVRDFVETHSELIQSKDKVEEILFTYCKLKKVFRHEKLLLFFLVNLFFISLEVSLENITFN